MNNLKTVLLVIGTIGLISALYGMAKGHIAEQLPGLVCASCLIYGYFDPNTKQENTNS